MSDKPLAEELMERMVKQYDSSVYSTDTEVTFNFSGEGAGKSPYYLKFQGGRVSWHQGELQYCKLTIECDAKTWEGILNKTVAWDMMNRPFIIKGNNFAMLVKFPQIFRFA